MAVLNCSSCKSHDLTSVGHRNLVTCNNCGNTWSPRGSSGDSHVKSFTDIKDEELPPKGNVFAPHSVKRINAGSIRKNGKKG